jgi:hypothetical protein
MDWPPLGMQDMSPSRRIADRNAVTAIHRTAKSAKSNKSTKD